MNFDKIKKLEASIEELNQILLDLKAKLSRLKNPDYPHYTDEELDAMFEVAQKIENKYLTKND